MRSPFVTCRGPSRPLMRRVFGASGVPAVFRARGDALTPGGLAFTKGTEAIALAPGGFNAPQVVGDHAEMRAADSEALTLTFPNGGFDADGHTFFVVGRALGTTTGTSGPWALIGPGSYIGPDAQSSGQFLSRIRSDEVYVDSDAQLAILANDRSETFDTLGQIAIIMIRFEAGHMIATVNNKVVAKEPITGGSRFFTEWRFGRNRLGGLMDFDLMEAGVVQNQYAQAIANELSAEWGPPAPLINPFLGGRIITAGNSVMAGSGDDDDSNGIYRGYANHWSRDVVMARHYDTVAFAGAQITPLGIDTGIGNGQQSFDASLTEISNDPTAFAGADGVIWSAGINDLQQASAPLGTMASRDNTTIYGAIWLSLSQYATHNPGKPLLVVGQPYTSGELTPNAQGVTGPMIRQAWADMSALFGNSYVNAGDLWDESNVAAMTIETSAPYTHPTTAGHIMMANRMAEVDPASIAAPVYDAPIGDDNLSWITRPYFTNPFALVGTEVEIFEGAAVYSGPDGTYTGQGADTYEIEVFDENGADVSGSITVDNSGARPRTVFTTTTPGPIRLQIRATHTASGSVSLSPIFEGIVRPLGYFFQRGFDPNAAGVTTADVWANPDIGDDVTGDGTEAAPYATLNHAAAQLAPGQTLGAWGVFREELDLSAIPGTAANPKIIDKRNGESYEIRGTAEISTRPLISDAADTAIFGSKAGQVRFFDVTIADLPSGDPGTAHVYENGQPLELCNRQGKDITDRIHQDYVHQYDDADQVITDGSNEITGYIWARGTEGLTEADVLRMRVRTYYQPNVGDEAVVSGYNATTGEVSIAPRAAGNRLYENNNYRDRVAFFNVLPAIEPGQWGYRDLGNGTARVYFIPYDEANQATSDFEHTTRGRAIVVGDHWHLRNGTCGRVASVNGSGGHAVYNGGSRKAGFRFYNWKITQAHMQSRDKGVITGSVDQMQMRFGEISDVYGHFGINTGGSGDGTAAGWDPSYDLWCDRVVFRNIAHTPTRLRVSARALMTHCLWDENSKGPHANKNTGYANSDQCTWYGCDMRTGDGYGAHHESSAMAMIGCVSSGAIGSGSVWRDQLGTAAVTPAEFNGTSGTTKLLFNTMLPDGISLNSSGGSAASVQYDNAGDPVNNYDVRGNLLHSVSDVGEANTVEGNYDTSSSVEPGDIAVPIDDIYEDWKSGDMRIKPTAPIRGKYGPSMAAEIAILMARHPDVPASTFQIDAYGNPIDWSDPPIGGVAGWDHGPGPAAWGQEPDFAGAPIVGEALSVSEGYAMGHNAHVRTYQWQQRTPAGVVSNIAGETGLSLRALVAGDEGNSIACLCTVGNDAYRTPWTEPVQAAHAFGIPTGAETNLRTSGMPTSTERTDTVTCVAGNALVALSARVTGTPSNPYAVTLGGVSGVHVGDSDDGTTMTSVYAFEGIPGGAQTLSVTPQATAFGIAVNIAFVPEGWAAISLADVSSDTYGILTQTVAPTVAESMLVNFIRVRGADNDEGLDRVTVFNSTVINETDSGGTSSFQDVTGAVSYRRMIGLDPVELVSERDTGGDIYGLAVLVAPVVAVGFAVDEGASGGTFSSSGGFRIWEGADTDTLVVTTGGDVDGIEIVGGGGGGGARLGGGGGAGEVVQLGTTALTAQTYLASVGAGGLARTGSNSDKQGNPGGTGGNTRLIGQTTDDLVQIALGGGGGGGLGDAAGVSGGSGGGAAGSSSLPSGGASTAADGVGFAGGAVTSNQAGAGGGGAGGAGSSNSGTSGGPGGAGIASLAPGLSQTIATGGPGGDATGTNTGDGINPGDGGAGSTGSLSDWSASRAGHGAAGIIRVWWPE